MQRQSAAVGRRICVVGTSGSGKTRLAQALAAELGLTYICNDAVIWRSNWQPTPEHEVYSELDLATREDGWTFDGNLGDSSADLLVLARCDTIVRLDLPRWQVHSQVIFRSLKRTVTRQPLWHGNTERWRTLLSRDSIVYWSFKSFGKRRRRYRALFRDPRCANRTLIRLCSRAATNAWLASVSSLGR